MDNLKHVNQLKKENERAQGKIKLLIKSCKQLEEEKEMLQKELSHLEEAAQEKQKTGGCHLGTSMRQTVFHQWNPGVSTQEVFSYSVLLWHADFRQLSIF